LQMIDMGIAQRHVEAAAKALGLPGRWKCLGADALPVVPAEYVVSWILQSTRCE